MAGGLPKTTAPPPPAQQESIKQTSLIFTPKQVYDINVLVALAKDKTPLPRLVLMGIMCGVYVGLGLSTCCLTGGMLSEQLRLEQPGVFNFLFAIFGFPLGLALIIFTGGDLFTGDCMYTISALCEGRMGVWSTLRILVTSWISNLAGSLLLVGLFTGAEVFEGREDFVVELAWKKCTLPWGVAFLRGVIANFLVCLAIWLANAARDFTGKFIGIWLPISAFVAMGFEHCVANMYLVPTAMVTAYRYDNIRGVISVGRFVWHNEIPVTLGNFVGGAILMALVYSVAYGRPGVAMDKGWEVLLACGHEIPGKSKQMKRVASAISVQLMRSATRKQLNDDDDERDGDSQV